MPRPDSHSIQCSAEASGISVTALRWATSSRSPSSRLANNSSSSAQAASLIAGQKYWSRRRRALMIERIAPPLISEVWPSARSRSCSASASRRRIGTQWAISRLTSAKVLAVSASLGRSTGESAPGGSAKGRSAVSDSPGGLAGGSSRSRRVRSRKKRMSGRPRPQRIPNRRIAGRCKLGQVLRRRSQSRGNCGRFGDRGNVR